MLPQKRVIRFGEFVGLMATMMSLTALSIDAMLPALTTIGSDLGVLIANDNQLIISFLFLGLAIGQLFYGPLSDSIGRKSAIYIGLSIFLVGCVISIFSPNLEFMLMGRCLQGIGLSGPRVVSIAIIRDQFKGKKMAQVMSFVMALFIAVPTIAPALGQGVLFFANWRYIFVLIFVLGVVTFIWFTFRQHETLPPQRRIQFKFSKLISATKEVLSNRVCLGYILAGGFISSAFVGFLNSSQQIFQIQFELGDIFPLYFAGVALSVGTASFVNGKLVMRFGMQRMVKTAIITLCLVSSIFYLITQFIITDPSVTVFMFYLVSTLFCVGILFGNINSLAMEPLGHIAGLGAAVVGSVATFISVPFGTFIGMQYDGTVDPMVLGFLIFGVLSALSIYFAESGKVK